MQQFNRAGAGAVSAADSKGGGSAAPAGGVARQTAPFGPASLAFPLDVNLMSMARPRDDELPVRDIVAEVPKVKPWGGASYEPGTLTKDAAAAPMWYQRLRQAHH